MDQSSNGAREEEWREERERMAADIERLENVVTRQRDDLLTMSHGSGSERESLLAHRVAEATHQREALEKQLAKHHRKAAQLESVSNGKKMPDLGSIGGENRNLDGLNPIDIIIDVSLKHGAGVMKSYNILRDVGRGGGVVSNLLHRWRKAQLIEWVDAIRPRAAPCWRLGQQQGGSPIAHSPIGLRMQAIVNQQPMRESLRSWHRSALEKSIAEEHFGVEMAQRLQIMHHKSSALRHRKGCMSLLRSPRPHPTAADRFDTLANTGVVVCGTLLPSLPRWLL